jgi:hypothetical protein
MFNAQAKQTVRHLLKAGMNAEQIAGATGYPAWVVRDCIAAVQRQEVLAKETLEAWKERRKQIAKLEIVNPIVKRNGKRIPPKPVRCCRCHALVSELADRYQLPICLHCSAKDDKRRMMIKPLAALALGLLVLTGCASAPSRATVEIKVAGQSVVMNFRK